MRQVDSKYRQFPIALDITEYLGDKGLNFQEGFISWRISLNLRYNVDFICFEHRLGYKRNSPVGQAYAFKDKSIALQFKLRFAGL